MSHVSNILGALALLIVLIPMALLLLYFRKIDKRSKETEHAMVEAITIMMHDEMARAEREIAAADAAADLEANDVDNVPDHRMGLADWRRPD